MVFIKQYFWLLLVLLLSIPTILPLFEPGFFQVHDDAQVARVYTMGRSLSDGMFPVRWVSDLGYGYGYPIFNFYGPLSYYIGGLFNVAGFDALLSTKIMFGIGILLSGVTMFLFIKNFWGNAAGVVAALLYMYFPYHAVNIYVRGAVNEFFAYALLPLVFWGIYRLYYTSVSNTQSALRWKWFVLTSLSIALVIITHNLSAYILLLLLFVLSLIFLATTLIFKRGFRFLILLLLAFILGGLISSFYSLPAVLELKYTNIGSILGGGSTYYDHYICLSQLWDSTWGFGGSVPGCIDGMSFKLGKVVIVLFVLSLFSTGFVFITKRAQEHRFLLVSSLIILFTSLFMTMPFSRFIWDLVPQAQFLQFPWRFLNFVGLFMSILIAYFVYVGEKMGGRKISVLLNIAIIGLVILYNAPLFKPQVIYSDKTSEFYTNFSNVHFTTSKISDEYMPKSFIKPKSLREVPKDKVTIKNGKVASLKATTIEIKAAVETQENTILTYNLAYFPAWKFYVDERRLEPQVGNDGVAISVPKGEHTVSATFEETRIELLGNGLTIAGMVLIFLVIIRRNRLKIL